MAKTSTRPANKPAKSAKSSATVRMTTGEAVVSSLLAHGIDTVYALPGVHNDHFFDALYKAGAEAIFPPGTVIADAAEELIRKLSTRLGHSSEAAE